MAIALVQQAAADASNVTSLTVTLTGAPTNGNKVFMGIASSQQVSSISQTGVTWTAVVTGGANPFAQIWVGVVGSGALVSATINWTTTTSPMAIVAEFSGVGTFDQNAGETTGTTSPISPNGATTLQGNELLLAVSNETDSAATFGPPTQGFTALTASATQHTNGNIVFAYLVASTAGVQIPPTWTDSSASPNWRAHTIAYNPIGIIPDDAFVPSRPLTVNRYIPAQKDLSEVPGSLFVMQPVDDEFRTVSWCPIPRPRRPVPSLEDAPRSQFVAPDDYFVQQRMRPNTIALRPVHRDSSVTIGGLFVTQPPEDEFRTVKWSPVTRVRSSQLVGDTDSMFPSPGIITAILVWGDSPFYKEANFVLGTVGAGGGKGIFFKTLTATSTPTASTLQTKTQIVVKGTGTAATYWIDVPGRWKPLTRAIISQSSGVTQRQVTIGANAVAVATNRLNKIVLGGGTTKTQVGAQSTATTNLSLVAQKQAQQIPITMTVSPPLVPAVSIQKKISLTLTVT